MMERNIICVRCPNGCEMTVKVEDDEIVDLEGHQCGEGVKHAEKEISNPERILTTTVRVRNGNLPLVSVRSSEPVDKEEMIPIMEQLASLEVSAPVEKGEVVGRNIEEGNVDIVATKSVNRKASGS